MVITDQDFPLAIQLTVMLLTLIVTQLTVIFLTLIVAQLTVTIARIISNTEYLEKNK
jgi:hypothetical protein